MASRGGGGNSVIDTAAGVVVNGMQPLALLGHKANRDKPKVVQLGDEG